MMDRALSRSAACSSGTPGSSHEGSAGGRPPVSARHVPVLSAVRAISHLGVTSAVGLDRALNVDCGPPPEPPRQKGLSLTVESCNATYWNSFNEWLSGTTGLLARTPLRVGHQPQGGFVADGRRC
eukprot:7356453-Pyramimonas_sp.AAC.1